MPASLRAGLLICFLFFFSAGLAEACDCAYPGAPCKAFANTPYIVSGRVVKIARIQGKSARGFEYSQRLVSVEVERTYRGIDKKGVIEIETGEGGGDCGFDFREGERYLIYAYWGKETRELYTGICSRTRLLSQAEADLEYFEKKDDPAHGSGIEGWIDKLSRGKDNNTEVVGTLAGVGVKIEGASGRWTVTTDKDGRFAVWGLKPGSYEVIPEWGSGFIPMSRTVKVAERCCEEVRFLATPPRHK